MNFSFEIIFLLNSLDTVEVPLITNAEFYRAMEMCLNQTTLLPAAFNATIKRINNHIGITVHYDGKYDYYKVNSMGRWGGACYVALGLNEPIETNLEDAGNQCEK